MLAVRPQNLPVHHALSHVGCNGLTRSCVFIGFAWRRRLIEFTAERGSYRGCRCVTTQGTDSCDEEEDDMEALVSEISKIGTAPKPLASKPGFVRSYWGYWAA